MTKKVVSILLLGVLVGALMGVPAAQAAPFAGAVTCQVTLSFPNPNGANETCGDANSGDPQGTAIGAGLNPNQVCVPGCAFEAQVDEYVEACEQGDVGFPLLGTANGTLFVDGAPIGRFNWIRVGLVAVIVPPDTAGVAAFVPAAGGATPTCAQAGTLTATVVGLGVVPL